MAKAKAITFAQFRALYGTEQACWDELYHLRFPEGFICPHCGCREYSFIHTRKTFQCKQCRHQTSVTAGTVMHRSHLPLTKWFWAIYLMANDKRGISAVQLSSMLEICYESAWTLLTKLRSAMGQRDAQYVLTGLVEMDDGFLGGPKRGEKRGRGSKRAKIIVALAKSKDDHPLFMHMQTAEDMKAATLQKFTDSFLAEGTDVECDNYISYRNLRGVNCMPKNYSTADGDLKWLHRAISNLKTFLKGTYHGRCTNQQAYLDEFCFRFNRRMKKDELFIRLVRAVATSNAC